MTESSVRNKCWHLRDQPAPDFAAHLDCDPVVAALLYQRALETPDAVEQFFAARYPNDLHDPFLMKDMWQASERVAAAIMADEPMAVYGDFDTDGVTAVTLLMQAIPALGGTIRPYIPHRTREGYGLNTAAVEHLAAEGIRLLITVDCGISNRVEVEHANRLGLDVIVTDHHRPPPELPPALAVVNPKQADCTYPYDQLVGVGIAFKLVQAVVKQLKRQGWPHQQIRGRDILDVVALGTVADMGPLNGENRVLVKAGIEALRQSERPGLKALIKTARLTQQRIDSTAIGFMLGPRINAAGRLDDAVRAYELLLADNMTTADALAAELNSANQQRQKLTQEVQAAAAELAESRGLHEQPLVLLADDQYPAGVVGLVAGRLVERWARPVVLVACGPDDARGSARSIAGFNIFEALTQCNDQVRADTGSDLFIRFGGHSLAAGFTIDPERLPTLETLLLAQAQARLSPDLLQPTLWLDVEVPFAHLGWELLHTLAAFEPFGQGNQQPVLLSRNLYAREARAIGSEGKHLKLRLCAENDRNGPSMDAIAFGLGDQSQKLRQHPYIDVAYVLEANTWQDRAQLQLNVKDFCYVQ